MLAEAKTAGREGARGRATKRKGAGQKEEPEKASATGERLLKLFSTGQELVMEDLDPLADCAVQNSKDVKSLIYASIEHRFLGWASLYGDLPSANQIILKQTKPRAVRLTFF